MSNQPKTPFNNNVLQVLVARAGFCNWGHPKEAGYFLHRLLQLAPFYEDYKAVERLFPSDGCYLQILYLVTDLDLMEHGGGVGGSWCRDEGEEVKEVLETVDWQQPAELSPIAFATEIKRPESEANWSLEEQVSHEAAFCGCGQPNAALAFLKGVFSKPLTFDAEHLVELIPDIGIRQFLLYQLFRLELIDHDWTLTPHGVEFVTKLAKVKDLRHDDEDDEDDNDGEIQPPE